MKIRHNSAPSSVWTNPVHFCAFGFGSGAAPFAPGTWGTLAAVPVYYLLSALPLYGYLGITLLLFLIGVWLCHVTAADIGVHDHSGIVWDEIVGYLLTMTAVPADLLWLVAGFVLFRLFDIVKPWPVRQVDRQVGGGFGIMLDDVFAALYAWLVLQVLLAVTV